MNAPQQKQGSGAGKVVAVLGIGCLLFILMACVGLSLGANWIGRQVGNFATDFAANQAVEAVKQSNLDDAQKQGVIGHIDRIRNDYKSGKISTAKLQRIAEKVFGGPLIPVAMSGHWTKKYVDDSKLTGKEKLAALRNQQRLARGVVEGSITRQEVMALLDKVQEPRMNKRGKRQGKKFKESLSPEELKDYLKSIEDAVNKAKIPDEPYTLDVAKEFGKAIDEALK